MLQSEHMTFLRVLARIPAAINFGQQSDMARRPHFLDACLTSRESRWPSSAELSRSNRLFPDGRWASQNAFLTLAPHGFWFAHAALHAGPTPHGAIIHCLLGGSQSHQFLACRQTLIFSFIMGRLWVESARTLVPTCCSTGIRKWKAMGFLAKLRLATANSILGMLPI